MIILDDMEYASDAAAWAAWVPSWEDTQTLSYALTSDSGVTAGANDRLVVPASAITLSGTRIQVTLQGIAGASSYTIGGCSIGERSGTTGNFASAPTRITFNGGNNSGTLPGALGTLTSDIIHFTVDETKTYLIHIWYSGKNARRYANGLLTRYYKQDYNTDDTLTQDISGLSYTNDAIMVGLKEFKIYEFNENPTSESIIKQQGSYAIKIICAQTTSLNETVTRILSPTFNLAGQTDIKFWVRASRTGSNFKLGFHDSGGTTTEVTPNIASADTWQEVTLDISAVTDANKDALNSIILTITNADAENTIYLDYMRALSEDEGTGTGGSPRFGGRSGGK